MATPAQNNAPATRLDLRAGGVAVLTLDCPDRSVNILSTRVMEEIAGRLDELEKQKDLRGLVIVSGKPSGFIAGADLTEFVAGLDQPKDEIVQVSRRGQLLFERLANTPYVTVAAINGLCVGGGAELAVWCDRRVVTESALIGFPEVKLGLFPGWGGTVRAPRIVGLSNAAEMITGGDNVAADEAQAMGLADDVVPNPKKGDDGSPLVDAAVRLIEQEQESKAYLADRERWAGPITQSETELAFLGATASAMVQQKTGGHYPAPMAALELLLEASQQDATAALASEAEAFAPLFGSPVNRALLNVFFLTDRAKKVAGDQPADKDFPRSAAVVGAGIMGQGIAAANVKRCVPVLLSDTRAEALGAGVAGVVREVSYNKKTKSADAGLAIERGALVNAATSPESLAACEVVIEAIIERADAKRELFAALEPHATERTILASNTSTIPITQLAEGLKHPERFCGLHFFNPVRKMPLVEVIRGEKTSDATVAQMAAYARRLGKTPVVVSDGPGFLVNRLLMPYMNEAALMAGEGVPTKAIEKTAKAFGMPMGPLELHDVVGLDTCLHAGRVMAAAFSDRVEPAGAVAAMVEAGRLGQKNGKGFYDWAPGKGGKPPKKTPSAEAGEILKAESSKAKAAGDYDLADRLLMPMLVEATRAVEDGIVPSVRDVDLALILGVGFPPHKGGLFHWADTVGAAEILKRLEPLAPLGKRFEPTEMIKKAAAGGVSFYDMIL
ncbi:Fatty acid oxidation complex subunit alpha [Pseudobythopirellula maris]|uniref:enoyl-CoA hydratase n=1 Tax=Pseudobythopirellula maris TaxID=2527991 RepID=A0A5C5ZNV5_9BACT|nr:3-hydroxyacyl-CoA dehydrogenase NAD-binding domain-containing protein [Pseudobythopirellula maris]TWT88765.1 Fatty acid oxidation complex subunit alpha [Pseudobythopirellula maris]